MKKYIIPIIMLAALCGCSSKDKTSSVVTETTTVPETQVVTTTETVTATAVTTTTTARNDEEDYAWFTKGVYEVRTGERDNDPDCDNRYNGDFYCFFDETHGEVINVYSGLTEKFTCEQKKDRIIFHSEYYSGGKFSYSSDSKLTPGLVKNGNVVCGGEFNRTTYLKLADVDPDTFNAGDYIDDYIIGSNVRTDFEEQVLGKKVQEDEDYVWADRGVYEVQIKAEKTPDKPYDDRFRGEFYVFYDANHGECYSAIDGILTEFTCVQKKNSMVFHCITVGENASEAMDTEYDVVFSNDPDDEYYDHLFYDENDNLTLAFSSTSMNKLIKLPGVDPDTFNAEDYRDNYVANTDQPRTVGAYSALGKKLD